MSDRSPKLSEVIRGAFEVGVSRLRVSCPARVEKYDSAKKRADVKLLLKDHWTDEDGKRDRKSVV